MARRPNQNENLHLFIGDMHIPFHDPKAMKLVLNFAWKYQPGTIHVIGDLVDFYSISSHVKNPRFRTPILEEIRQARDFLVLLRKKCPDAIIHYSEGNHEYRLQRYLHREAPELAELPTLELPKLMSLKKLGVKWHPEPLQPYYVGKLGVKHGTLIRQQSGYTARGELDKTGGCVISGHTHRMGSHYRTTAKSMKGAWENGCLCLIDPRVHEYTKGAPNWQQGFSVAQFQGPLFQVEQVLILRQGGEPGFIFHGRWHSASATD